MIEKKTFIEWLHAPVPKENRLAYKIQVFEEIVNQLVIEAKQKTENFDESNDFVPLKVMKLFFFVCSINSNEDATLLNIFDFHAMPYGPIEIDIHNYIKTNHGQFNGFKLVNDIPGYIKT